MIQLWLIYVLLSAFFRSIQDIFVKKFEKNKNTHPTQIMFVQYLLLMVIMVGIFYFKIDFLSFTKYWNLYLLKTISLGLAIYIYFLLLERFEISKVSPLMNISPIFLLILSTVFLDEIITLQQLLGILIIIISTYVLEVNVKFHHEIHPHKHHLDWLYKIDKKNILLVLSMLFIISITAISDKMIFNNNINIYSNMFFTSFILLFFISVYYIYNKKFTNLFTFIKTNPSILVVSSFSIASTFFVLMAISIPTAMVSLVVPIKRVSTLFTAIFGGMIFSETHLLKKSFAIITMLLGIVLIAL